MLTVSPSSCFYVVQVYPVYMRRPHSFSGRSAWVAAVAIRPRSVRQTRDSGYIVLGYTNSVDSDVVGKMDGSDYWLVKLTAAGGIQWQKCLGGSNNDVGWYVEQTKDNGYVVIGYTNSNDAEISGNHGSWDYWVAKLDDTGRIQWQKCLGGDTVDIPRCIQQTTDSGYIITGGTLSTNGDVTAGHGGGDCWVIKLSKTGSLQWQQTYGGSSGDAGIAIKQTIDGGYILACSSSSADGDVAANKGNNDVWILKLSATGAISWKKNYGGSGNDYADDIQQTADSGYIVACSSNSTDSDVTGNHGDFDYWLMKLSQTGSIQWQRSYGGSNADFANAVQQTKEGGYIVAGVTFSNDSDVTGFKGTSDMWVVKVSGTGNLQWQNAMGGSSYDGAAAIQQTFDSGYIVVGYTSSADSDVTGYRGATDYWVVKLGDTVHAHTDTTHTDTTIASAVVTTVEQPISIMPNPVVDVLTVTAQFAISDVTILSIMGQVLGTYTFNSTAVHVSVADLPRGIYLVRINGGRVLRIAKE